MKNILIQFISNGQVFNSVKKKDYFEKDRKSHVGRIVMQNVINFVNCDNQNFQIMNVFLIGLKTFSMETEFINKGTKNPLETKNAKKYNNVNIIHTV